MNPIAIVLIVIALIGIGVLVSAVKIVRPYQRGLVERLGKYKTTREPGLNLILPFIETMQLIDMREQVVDVPPQEVITADNVVVSVDAVVYYEATDPQRLVYNVADFFTAITKLAQTNLRNLIGDLELDRALTSRDTINTQLRDVLDDATDKWGVRVVRVEIQRIDPPPDIVSAMHAQMRAERDRRATVTEAKGYQEAAIARADGEQQAAVLSAQGRKQAAVLDAEGQAQAIELRANAEKLQLELIGQGEGNAAKARLTGIKEAGADKSVLTVEYLQALERIGDGRATKLVIPAEFSGLLGTVAALAAAAGDDDTDDEVRPQGRAADPRRRRTGRSPRAGPFGDPSIVMRRVDAPRAGWYPDPESRTNLRYWDGLDWTDGTAIAAERGRAAVVRATRGVRGGPSVRRADGGERRPGRPRRASWVQTGDSQQIVDDVRRAARSEVDRAADLFSQRARQMQREIVPLVSQYTNRFVQVDPIRSDRCGGAVGCLLRVPGRRPGEPVRVDRRPHRQLHRRPERRHDHTLGLNRQVPSRYEKRYVPGVMR